MTAGPQKRIAAAKGAIFLQLMFVVLRITINLNNHKMKKVELFLSYIIGLFSKMYSLKINATLI